MGIFPEMLVCGDITVTTSCTDLAITILSIRLITCGSILYTVATVNTQLYQVF